MQDAGPCNAVILDKCRRGLLHITPVPIYPFSLTDTLRYIGIYVSKDVDIFYLLQMNPFSVTLTH